MKFAKYTLAFLAISHLTSAPAHAGELSIADGLHDPAPADQWTSARPDGHAPIGVMADHTHHAGEWMVSYTHMYMHMEGNRRGTDTISDHEVFASGFDVAPQSMEMNMNMIMVMFAPTDWLTLGAMTHYNYTEMELMANPHAEMHGGDHGGGHGHTGTFGHSSEGWGDTTLNALLRLFDAGSHTAHLGLGIGFPTADVEIKQAGVYLPYGMQTGRGLWDFRPSLTYLGQSNHLSWGGQISGIIGLEEENGAGYVPGDVINATAWSALKVNDRASVSTRLNYTHQEGWDGHFNGPHGHASPTHFISNWGGEVIELGVGLNLYAPDGALKGNRFAIEALLPVYQDANGIQMDREFTIVAGWQLSF